ncbi:response regulator [Neomicrococcus aestuarii]|uniref:DNA-binding response regulator n=1 Tax=Neomicrococcus aestuarii TaxID=556325 RepID=A0A1L2ZPA7_9MICC|nr:response regulator transcription factor [Neomicrococcus aestuarii]APF41010.1 DNA-binding response regulator [Neomicrococcus aestuarii]
MTAHESTTNQHLNILLVDDQRLLRMGFRLILEGEDDFTVVGEASNGREGVEMTELLAPDIVLMDVRMPEMDGIEATRRIAAEYPEVKVIILTTFDVDEHAFAGLRAGASAFLLKDVEPEELVSAVRVVASGDAVVAPRVTQRLLETYVRPVNPGAARTQSTPGSPYAGGNLAEGGHRTAPGGVVPFAGGTAAAPHTAHSGPGGDLTPREMEVLGAISEGLSNAEIASRFFLSEATVKTHVRRILTKLDLRDRVQAVVYAYEHGLVVPGSNGS